ncbi:MAG: hypothetical protein EA405_10180 [Rhodospirillales bacterium]|nr:MAG: hypothetical protein EA405_10180 [Rhodospirillales bacterium]
MKLFVCSQCRNLLYFDNISCGGCGARLGFLPDETTLVALDGVGDGLWQPVGVPGRYRVCANEAAHGVCNWMVAADDDDSFCVSCRLNRTIPDLSIATNKALWHTLEREKRWLVYALLRFGLAVTPMRQVPSGLAFDFLADDEPAFNEHGRVLTGHAQGVITLNIAEADPVVRERLRNKMAEPYRTVLGHFRHESGHYYWDRLVRDGPWLEPFRSMFGDERRDYGQALERHYRCGPPPGWPDHFVSAYAGAHPWEDWAETWAHYLHICDTLETAFAFGLRIRPRLSGRDATDVQNGVDAYDQEDFQQLIGHWFPLTLALNSLNRSMGHEHAYPFVLAPAVVEKLAFVHRVVRAGRCPPKPQSLGSALQA